MPLGAPTGPRRNLSTPGLPRVPATLRTGEERVRPVADREAELRPQGCVVLAPVREEVTGALGERSEEPPEAHFPPPSLRWYRSTGIRRSSGSASLFRHGSIVSA